MCAARGCLPERARSCLGSVPGLRGLAQPPKADVGGRRGIPLAAGPYQPLACSAVGGVEDGTRQAWMAGAGREGVSLGGQGKVGGGDVEGGGSHQGRVGASPSGSGSAAVPWAGAGAGVGAGVVVLQGLQAIRPYSVGSSMEGIRDGVGASGSSLSFPTARSPSTQRVLSLGGEGGAVGVVGRVGSVARLAGSTGGGRFQGSEVVAGKGGGGGSDVDHGDKT